MSTGFLPQKSYVAGNSLDAYLFTESLRRAKAAAPKAINAISESEDIAIADESPVCGRAPS